MISKLEQDEFDYPLWLKTWSTSTMELILPEWYEYDGIFYFKDSRFSEVIRYRTILKQAMTSRGREKAEALAKLIILLWENNLLKGENE